MKFKVKGCQDEKTVFFGLEETGSRICLYAYDEDGSSMISGHILSINSDGTLSLARGVTRDAGLCLTNGKITIK